MKYMAAHFGINEDYLENTNHLCTLNFLRIHQQKDKELPNEYSKKLNIPFNHFWGGQSL